MARMPSVINGSCLHYRRSRIRVFSRNPGLLGLIPILCTNYLVHFGSRSCKLDFGYGDRDLLRTRYCVPRDATTVFGPLHFATASRKRTSLRGPLGPVKRASKKGAKRKEGWTKGKGGGSTWRMICEALVSRKGNNARGHRQWKIPKRRDCNLAVAEGFYDGAGYLPRRILLSFRANLITRVMAVSICYAPFRGHEESP